MNNKLYTITIPTMKPKNCFSFILNFTILAVLTTNFIPSFAQDCKVLDPNFVGIYEGNCKNGKADGKGKSIGKYIYEGDFKAGFPHGQGKMSDSTGSIIHSGYWKKGLFIGEYEHPYILLNKTFMVSGVTITADPATPPHSTIELSMESVSGGAFNVHGEIPKPTLSNANFQLGSYQNMSAITSQQKRNTYVFQNVIFPAHVIFKIGDEEVQIEFNEAKNYKVFITTRD